MIFIVFQSGILILWASIHFNSWVPFVHVLGIEKSVSSKSSVNCDLSASPSYYMPTSQFFDWNAYLKETNSEAAPAHCFKQVCV